MEEHGASEAHKNELLNYDILRIGGALVHPKLGMIFENKVVQKLKLEKNVFYKKGLLNQYS